MGFDTRSRRIEVGIDIQMGQIIASLKPHGHVVIGDGNCRA